MCGAYISSDDIDNEEAEDVVDDDGPLGDGVSDDELVLFDEQYEAIDPEQCIYRNDNVVGIDTDNTDNSMHNDHNFNRQYNLRPRKRINYSDM